MEDCIFCKIVKGEIPCSKLYEDEEVLAFKDIGPQAPVHFLVVPKRHIPNLMALGPKDEGLVGHLVVVAQDLLRNQGCEAKGGRLVLNCKSDGGQTVDHIHVHVLGGRTLTWPPG